MVNLEWKKVSMTKWKDSVYIEGSYDTAKGIKVPIWFKIIFYPIISFFETCCTEWHVKEWLS